MHAESGFYKNRMACKSRDMDLMFAQNLLQLQAILREPGFPLVNIHLTLAFFSSSVLYLLFSLATGDHAGELQQQRSLQQEEGALQEGPCAGSLGGDGYPKFPGEGRENRQGKPVPQGRADGGCGGCPQARQVEEKSVWLVGFWPVQNVCCDMEVFNNALCTCCSPR